MTDPSFRIKSPEDGSILPYGNVNITWTAAPGAVDYKVIVTDLENYSNHTNGYEIDLPGGASRLLLTANQLISGHQYNVIIYEDTTDSITLKTNPIRFKRAD